MQDAYNLAVTAVVMVILLIIINCVRCIVKRMHLRVQCQRGDVETGEDTGVQLEEVVTPTPPATLSKNKRANPSPPPSPRVTRATKKGRRKGEAVAVSDLSLFFFI